MKFFFKIQLFSKSKIGQYSKLQYFLNNHVQGSFQNRKQSAKRYEIYTEDEEEDDDEQDNEENDVEEEGEDDDNEDDEEEQTYAEVIAVKKYRYLFLFVLLTSTICIELA